METNHTKQLFKSIRFRVLFFLAFYGMLHSSLVLPAQNLVSILDYNFARQREYGTFITNHLDGNSLIKNIDKDIIPAYNKSNLNNNEHNISSETVFSSDISEGIIGKSDLLDYDAADDNYFTFHIDQIPENANTAYLQYDLYGSNDFNSVSKSINNRPASGGYVGYRNAEWTYQQEEIDITWLNEGNNIIGFSLPSQASHFYKVRNVKIEFRNKVANSLSVNLSKEILINDKNEIYIHGFIKDPVDNPVIQVNGKVFDVFENEFEGFLPIDIARRNNIITVSYLEGNTLVDKQMFTIKNLKKAEFSLNPVMPSPTASKEFTSDIMQDISIGTTSLSVDRGALKEKTIIQISKLRDIDIAPLNPGMVNVTKNSTAYRFTPDGLTFEKAASLAIEYDTTLIPSGYTVNDIVTFFFNTKNKRWEAIAIDSIDRNNQLVLSKTTHFTDYINGIIKVPESPQTNAFTPTMMNDIKAANPAANITLMGAPEASQTGEANLTYPITIPAGRLGMQPNLTLHYNSDGGSGWLGQGWNINLPSISIDTRWGVPTFGIDKDGNGQIQGVEEEVETEIYQIDGNQLMYPQYENSLGEKMDWMPHRHQIDKNGIITTNSMHKLSAENAFFSLRKQGNFAKIQRLGNSPKEYYWKVTSTDGTINWYGGTKPEDLLPENSNRGIITDNLGNIVHWALVKSEDVYGNFVSYSYETISNITTEGLNDGKAFYVRLISYTGHPGLTPQYNVIFKRKANIRSDVNITTRLGLKQIDPYLLEAINIQYQGVTFKSYILDYSTARFNKTLLKSITESDNGDNSFLAYY